MKKIIFILSAVLPVLPAIAGYDDKQFKTEIINGLDIVTVQKNPAPIKPEPIHGQLSANVYGESEPIETDYSIYIPTRMYVRGGVGLTIGKLSGTANLAGISGGSAVQLGMGWNLLSYVRTELGFQSQTLDFANMPNISANLNDLNATLYFDLAKRFIRTGDITIRRTFVPFLGFGIAGGNYKFDDAGTLTGQSGGFIGPRATFGFNIMLNNLMGLDIAYQYTALINGGFGWGPYAHGKTTSINNIMGTLRYNF